MWDAEGHGGPVIGAMCRHCRAAAAVARRGLCRWWLVVGSSGVFSSVPSWLLGLFRAFPEGKELRNYGNGDVTSRHSYKFGCVIL